MPSHRVRPTGTCSQAAWRDVGHSSWEGRGGEGRGEDMRWDWVESKLLLDTTKCIEQPRESATHILGL